MQEPLDRKDHGNLIFRVEKITGDYDELPCVECTENTPSPRDGMDGGVVQTPTSAVPIEPSSA